MDNIVILSYSNQDFAPATPYTDGTGQNFSNIPGTPSHPRIPAISNPPNINARGFLSTFPASTYSPVLEAGGIYPSSVTVPTGASNVVSIFRSQTKAFQM